MIQALMPSCHERDGEREKTLAQLAQFGIEPLVILPHASDGRLPSPRRHTRQAYRGLAQLSPKHGALFVEDDIDLAPSFGWWLEQCQQQEAVVWLYVPGTKFYSPEVQAMIAAGIAYDPQFVPLEPFPYGLGHDPDAPIDQCGLVGSQAIWLPRRMVIVLRGLADASWRMQWTGFDREIREVALMEQIPIVGAIPNPVQHRAVRSTMLWMLRHQSATFVGAGCVPGHQPARMVAPTSLNAMSDATNNNRRDDYRPVSGALCCSAYVHRPPDVSTAPRCARAR